MLIITSTQKIEKVDSKEVSQLQICNMWFLFEINKISKKLCDKSRLYQTITTLILKGNLIGQ